MSIELYEHAGSVTSNSIRVLAKRIGVEVHGHAVDLLNNEHRKPEYLQINPFHTVPAIVDDGFHLFESKAILTYLVSKYAPESDLYPKDVQARATVDSILHYDNSSISVLYIHRLHSIKGTGRDAEQIVVDKTKDNLKCLDNVLGTRKYIAGDHLTVADISVVHTLLIAEALDGSLESYEHLNEYNVRVRGELGSYFDEVNAGTVKKIQDFVQLHKKE